MKNEQGLKISYEKQKKIFEEGKLRKISNLEKREEEISQKIAHLNQLLKEVQATKKETLERSFRSFEDYQKAAELQSQQKRTANNN